MCEITCRPECFEDFEQRFVDHDDLVLRILDDEGEFVGEQARVQGVDDRTYPRDREVQLEVLTLIPQQGGNRVSLAYAKFGQRTGKPTGPAGAGTRALRG